MEVHLLYLEFMQLIENNQTPDSIIIPKALQAYTGFDIIK